MNEQTAQNQSELRMHWAHRHTGLVRWFVACCRCFEMRLILFTNIVDGRRRRHNTLYTPNAILQRWKGSRRRLQTENVIKIQRKTKKQKHKKLDSKMYFISMHRTLHTHFIHKTHIYLHTSRFLWSVVCVSSFFFFLFFLSPLCVRSI